MKTQDRVRKYFEKNPSANVSMAALALGVHYNTIKYHYDRLGLSQKPAPQMPASATSDKVCTLDKAMSELEKAGWERVPLRDEGDKTAIDVSENARLVAIPREALMHHNGDVYMRAVDMRVLVDAT